MNSRRLFLVLLAAGSLLLAWQHYFLQDDAYISFTYARHFAEGYGLVWYPDSTEFGYTNFLFTLLVGALMWLGFAPETAAAMISIPSTIATVLLVFFLVEKLCNKRFVAHTAAIATAMHFSVSAYASGGLETSFHMLLITLSYYFAFAYRQNPSHKNALKVAFVASLALLCRLDSAVLLFPAYLLLAVDFALKTNQRRGDALLLVAVPVASVVALLAGCYVFYGAALPNTFYAKFLLSRNYYFEGLRYLAAYVQMQCYLPILLLLAALIVPAIRGNWRACWTKELLCLLGVVMVWLGYIIDIGGDFMEFRLLVSIIPLFYVMCFVAIARSFAAVSPVLWGVLLGVSLAANLYHQYGFQPSSSLESTGHLNYQVRNERTGWSLAGKALGDLFYTGAPEDVSLAVHTAGALPYYSRLPTVDIYGLNDRWVAQHGQTGATVAGHRKKAPFSYLVQRKVNIVFPALPIYICGDAVPENIVRPYNNLPALLIPLETDCKVVGYYLTPHTDVEKALADGKIRLFKPEEKAL